MIKDKFLELMEAAHDLGFIYATLEGTEPPDDIEGFVDMLKDIHTKKISINEQLYIIFEVGYKQGKEQR